MTSINNISRQPYAPTVKGAGQESSCDKQCSSSYPIFDTCIFDDGTQHWLQDFPKRPFPNSMAMNLAEMYTPKNMSRNQYTDLIVSLRDNDILTLQEFSVAYGGTMASTDCSISWPHGKEKINFTSFLQACALSCKKTGETFPEGTSERATCEFLNTTYTHLYEILGKIEYASKELTEKNALYQNGNPEVDRLTNLLKQDKSFFENTYRDFLSHPIGRQLASALILADEGVQAQIAEKLSVSISQMKSMLQSKNSATVDQVLIKYQHILVQKARTEGLTDTEMMLDDRLEGINLASQGNFDERMHKIQKEIEQEFEKNNTSINPSKSFSFHFNTSTLKFSVTGGSREENSSIERIINRENNLSATLVILLGQRGETPEYSEKIEQLFSAWNQQNQNDYLKKRYGFDWSDIEYIGNGTIVGKSHTITDTISKLGTNFIKFGGGAFLSEIHYNLLKQYGFGLNEVDFTEDGKIIGKTDEVSKIIEEGGDDIINSIKHPALVSIPDLDNPLFVLEGGHFKVL